MEGLIGQTLGQYRIVEPIGEGGMATVYKAYQPGLDRYVAVKVLPPIHAKTPGFSERFVREAKAIAGLHHPNILPVYDFGQDDGYSFIVMRYIEGARTLRDVMAEPLSLEQIAGLMEQIAAALDHAHRQGVIHRDVKPANVLMDEDWALLTDFGLAKMTEASVKLTGSGVGVGTPAYMSPEQGQGLEIDHRTDIYSLGIILFEMLTGKIPHEAETPFAIVLKRVTEPLPMPRSINPGIPEPVERVILKALATDPADRFESVGEMAAALRKACETVEGALVFEREALVPAVDEVEQDKVTPARLTPASPARHVRIGEAAVEREAPPIRQVVPLWVWGALGVALLLAVALAWVLLSGREAESTPTAVAVAQATTPAAAVQLPTPTYTPLPPTSTPLRTAPPTPVLPTDTPTPVPLSLPKVTISPDNVGELVEIARLGEGRAGGRSLAFSPDGWILASPEGNNVNLWRVSDGALLQTLSGHKYNIGSLAFSSDGTLLASAVMGEAAMENIRLSRVSDGTLLRSLLSFYVSTLAFSPDGEILAVGKRLGEVEFWDVSKGSMLFELVGHTDQEKGKSKDVNDLAFSPDGEILASCAYKAKLWRVFDGTLLRTLDAPGYVDSLAFSPDGEIVATGDGNTVQFWRVSDGGLLLTLEGHTDDVRSLVFSPSGELLASLSDDKTVRLWRVSDGALLRTLEMEGFKGYMSRHKVDFSPDGTLLAFGGVDGTIRLWGIDARAAQPHAVLYLHSAAGFYTEGPEQHPRWDWWQAIRVPRMRHWTVEESVARLTSPWVGGRMILSR
jgi:WD40 repeat protein